MEGWGRSMLSLPASLGTPRAGLADEPGRGKHMTQGNVSRAWQDALVVTLGSLVSSESREAL